MELEDARYIANRVVGRLLSDLPKETKAQLFKPGEDEDALFFRLLENASSTIQQAATELEKQERERRL